MDKDTWVITDGEVYVAVVRERQNLFEVTLSFKNPQPTKGREGYPDSLFHSFDVNLTLEFSGGEVTFSIVPFRRINLDTPQVYEDWITLEDGRYDKATVFTFTYRELAEFLAGTTGRSGKSPIVRLMEEMVRRINALHLYPPRWEYTTVWEVFEPTIYDKTSDIMSKVSGRLPKDVRVFLFKSKMSFKGTIPTFELSSVSFTGNEFQVTLKVQPSKIKFHIPFMVSIPIDLLIENPNVIEEIRSVLEDAFTDPKIFGDMSEWFVNDYLSSTISKYVKEYLTYPPERNLITNSLPAFVRRKLSEKGIEWNESKIRDAARLLSNYALDLFGGYETQETFKFTSGTVSTLDVSVDSSNDWTDIIGKVYSSPTKVPSWEKFSYEYKDLTHLKGKIQYFGNKTTDYTYFIVVFEVREDPNVVRNLLDGFEEERPNIHKLLGTVTLLADRIHTSGSFLPIHTSVARNKVTSMRNVVDWIHKNLSEEGEQE